MNPVQWIINFFKSTFGYMFRRTGDNARLRLTSRIRRNTVGKAQAKMHTAMGKMDQKINRGQDKMLGKAGMSGRSIGPNANMPGRKPAPPAAAPAVTDSKD